MKIPSDASGACRTAGHTDVAFDAATNDVRVCATTKGADDDVTCWQRNANVVNQQFTGAGDQDHAWMVFTTAGDLVSGFHDGALQDDLVEIGAHPKVALGCNAATCGNHQQRPSLFLTASPSLLAAFEEQTGGSTGTREGKFGWCPAATWYQCLQGSWVWDTASFDPNPGGLPRKFPHVATSDCHAWIRYEATLSGGLVEALVSRRDLPLVAGAPWTRVDPIAGAPTVSEVTEEYGTPHLAVQRNPVLPDVVATTALLTRVNDTADLVVLTQSESCL